MDNKLIQIKILDGPLKDIEISVNDDIIFGDFLQLPGKLFKSEDNFNYFEIFRYKYTENGLKFFGNIGR